MQLYFVFDRERWGHLYSIVRAMSPEDAIRMTVIGWERRIGLESREGLTLRKVVGAGAQREISEHVPEGCECWQLFDDGEAQRTLVLHLRQDGPPETLWEESDSPDSPRD